MNPRARPVTFPTFHCSLLSACGYCAQSDCVSLQSDSDLFRGHSTNAKRIPLVIPKDSLCRIEQGQGEDGKGTLPNFFLSIIWKNSSQFVTIPFLPHCLPPAEHITPGGLSGIQGPSRKKSPEF